MLENIAVSFAMPLAYFGMFLGASSALVFPLIKAILELLLKSESRTNKIIVIGSSFAGVLVWMIVAFFNVVWAFALFVILMFGKMAMEIIIVKDYKSLVTIFGILAGGLVFLVCFMMAGDADFTIGEIHVVGSQMQLVEAGIFTFYILLAVSLLAILYSTVSQYFK